MDGSTFFSPLADRVARTIEAINRLPVDTTRPRSRTRRKHLAEAIAGARTAVVSGDPLLLKAALSSLDLLSLELCED